MKWFYKIENSEVGPLDDEAFASLILNDQITLNTPVRNEDMGEWAPLSEMIRRMEGDEEPEESDPPPPTPISAEPAIEPPPLSSSIRPRLLDSTEAEKEEAAPPLLAPISTRTPLRLSITRQESPRRHSGPEASDNAAEEESNVVIPMDEEEAVPEPLVLQHPAPRHSKPDPAGEPSRPIGLLHRLSADMADIACSILIFLAVWHFSPSAWKDAHLTALLFGDLGMIILFHAFCILTLGGTIGLRFFRLRLRNESGKRCGLFQSLGYPISLAIALAPVGLGLLTARLTYAHAPLHDFLTRTRIERPSSKT